MASDADICNLAILRIGQRGSRIQSLEDATPIAQACAIAYPLARDAVLAEFPWQFATKRLALAIVSGAVRVGWGYVYGLPSDCIDARYLWAGIRNPSRDQMIPFILEDGTADSVDGSILLTDQLEAVLVYTAKVENTARFPPLFVQALAWKVAAELALGIPNKPQIGLAMSAQYIAAVRLAASRDLNQSQGDAEPDSELVRVR